MRVYLFCQGVFSGGSACEPLAVSACRYTLSSTVPVRCPGSSWDQEPVGPSALRDGVFSGTPDHPWSSGVHRHCTVALSDRQATTRTFYLFSNNKRSSHRFCLILARFQTPPTPPPTTTHIHTPPSDRISSDAICTSILNQLTNNTSTGGKL